MTEPPNHLPVSAEALQEMFNAGGYVEKVERGVLAVEIRRDKHPAPPKANQPYCTCSQILAYLNADGNRIAVVHQYLLPDGKLGGSGRPDPKALLVGDTLYYVPALPPPPDPEDSPQAREFPVDSD
jgi:hypothetical protein